MAAPSMLEKPISADETTTGAEQTAATVERKLSTDAQTATRQPAFATAMSSEVPASLTGAAAPTTATPAVAKAGAAGSAAAKGAAPVAGAVGPGGPAAAKMAGTPAGPAVPTGVVAAAPIEGAEAVSAEPAAVPAPPSGEAGAAEKPAKPKVRTPASDPRFHKVITRLDKSAAKTKKHPPAAKKAAQAHAAARQPENERTSKAQANKVTAMQGAETKKPDPDSFLKLVLAAIKAIMPTNEQGTKDFMKGKQKEQVKGALQGNLDKQKADATGDLKNASAQKPDDSQIPKEQPTPLPAETSVHPPEVGAAEAIPEPKPASEVSLQDSKQAADDKMKEAQVTPEQLKAANDSRFTAVLESKSAVDKHADAGPKQYTADEQKLLGQEAAKAVADEKHGLTALQTVHDKSGVAVRGNQTTAQTQDEARRKEVSNHIASIYDKTKQSVDEKLKSVDDEVSRVFDQGLADAMQHMTDYVNKSLDDRYGGVLGFFTKIDEALGLLPDEAVKIYEAGRNLFMGEMDSLIRKIAAIVENRLKEAKDEIAKGQQEIHTYVEGLPKDLQAIGKAAEQDIAGRFDEMRHGVDEKKNELAQKLAQRYKEASEKADEKLKQIQEEQKGLLGGFFDKLAEVAKLLRDFRDRVSKMLNTGRETILLIVAHPIDFLKHVIDAIKLGVNQFVDNIWTHLKAGFMAWLFGTLEDAGIEIPKDFSLGSLLKLVLQILGITYPKMRAKFVKLIGERNVMIIEKVAQIIYTLVTGGPEALWEQIKEFLGNLKEMVIDAIQNWIVSTVIKNAVIKLLALFIPVSAIMEAIEGIYHTVNFFIQRINQILTFVESIINSVHKIAIGDIADAANWIEKALAKTIPIIIGFLAEFLGLGDLSEKIREIITKIQKFVDEAIDKVLDKIVKFVKSLFGKGKEEKPDDRTPEQKQADLDKAIAEAEQLLGDERESPEQIKKQLPKIKSKYNMTSLELVTDSEGDAEESDHIHGEINPSGNTSKKTKKRTRETRFLPKGFDVRNKLYINGSEVGKVKEEIRDRDMKKILTAIKKIHSTDTPEAEKMSIWVKLLQAGQVPDGGDMDTYTVADAENAEYEVDHKTPLAQHWVEEGFNTTDRQRWAIASGRANLQLMLARENEKKQAGGFKYGQKPYVGSSFTSIYNKCRPGSLTIGDDEESFLDEGGSPLKK